MKSINLKPVYMEELARILEMHSAGFSVLAYGSRVTGGAHGGSDLDLVIRHPNDDTQNFPNLSKLKTALRESNLPITVDVHDWSQLPESFRREVEKSCIHLEF